MHSDTVILYPFDWKVGFKPAFLPMTMWSPCSMTFWFPIFRNAYSCPKSSFKKTEVYIWGFWMELWSQNCISSCSDLVLRASFSEKLSIFQRSLLVDKKGNSDFHSCLCLIIWWCTDGSMQYLKTLWPQLTSWWTYRNKIDLKVYIFYWNIELMPLSSLFHKI